MKKEAEITNSTFFVTNDLKRDPKECQKNLHSWHFRQENGDLPQRQAVIQTSAQGAFPYQYPGGCLAT